MLRCESGTIFGPGRRARGMQQQRDITGGGEAARSVRPGRGEVG